MHCNTLERFRQQMYGCFERSRDALFNVCDALASEPQARSLPELSLLAFFERRWPSVYEALQDGRIDVKRLRQVGGAAAGGGAWQWWVVIFTGHNDIRKISSVETLDSALPVLVSNQAAISRLRY